MLSCGIDFGTSNSAIALSSNGAVTLAPVEDEQTTLPTALFYAAQTPVPHTGRAAQKLFFEGEDGRFMRSLKRILGTGLMQQTTIVNGRPKKFDVIIADFIRHLKTRAEAAAGVELTHVVMGRPVHFVDGSDAADRAAEHQLATIARHTGFQHIAFQFEPIAAAFAHEQRVARETIALVVDVGGGTSDFTVIKICADYTTKTDRKDDILGNSGIRTGGNDFDKQLSLHSFMPAFGYRSTYGDKHLTVPVSPFHDMSEWSKVNFLYTPKIRQEMREIFKESHAPDLFGRYVDILTHETGHKLLAAIEDMKIDLTQNTQSTAALDFIEDHFNIAATQDDFNTAITPDIDNVSTAMHDCLRQSGVIARDIGMVILTGGPTAMPLLQKTVRDAFPHAEVSEENRMSSVALGLGYDSRRLFGATTS